MLRARTVATNCYLLPTKTQQHPVLLSNPIRPNWIRRHPTSKRVEADVLSNEQQDHSREMTCIHIPPLSYPRCYESNGRVKIRCLPRNERLFSVVFETSKFRCSSYRKNAPQAQEQSKNNSHITSITYHWLVQRAQLGRVVEKMMEQSEIGELT